MSKPVISDFSTDIKNDLIKGLKYEQGEKSNWSSLTVLIVTIIIFFSIGIASFTLQDILILIGVLLFHETGHLAAMKIFKYSDVKMFFIPFFGAAVSGKPERDSAVKSCIVSLMGPLPGLLLGVLVAILFALTKNYYFFKTASMLLVLNAFNLLPIMPLDGGRYIDVLFINRRYFRLIFALLGAAVFLFMALSGSLILGLVGVFSILSAFTNFKIHGIAKSLKDQGINANSVDALLEDEAAMQITALKLEEKFPKLFNPKIMYKPILGYLTIIVDTIKFVPAKLLSKAILLILYVVIVFVSFTMASSFVAMDYREKARVVNRDGEKIVYSERYFLGSKMSQCPIDSSFYYHGKGTGFNRDSTISDIFHYSHGYRVGEWQFFDSTGTVIRKEIYDKGQLQSVSVLENGEWKTTPYKELPLWERIGEAIRKYFQPVKSNHLFFKSN